jgi:hypothetical protein
MLAQGELILTRIIPFAELIPARDGREALEILETLTKLPNTIFLDIICRLWTVKAV